MVVNLHSEWTGKTAAAMALKQAQSRNSIQSVISLIQPSIVARASSSRVQTEGKRVNVPLGTFCLSDCLSRPPPVVF